MLGLVPKRILIVDDDDGLRFFYRRALQSAGFETQDAGDSVTALSLIDEHAPDLILLDLDLHDGHGCGLHEELTARAHTRQIPILIATGSTQNLDHLRVSCVLRKPLSLEQLIEAAQQCLRMQAAKP